MVRRDRRGLRVWMPQIVRLIYAPCINSCPIQACSVVLLFPITAPRPRLHLSQYNLYSSNFGGLSGADGVCASEASSAGLTGTFMAWLSDSTSSPSTRFTQSSKGYVLVNNTVVATSWADLVDGTLAVPINVTADGTVDPTPRTTATSTDADGTAISTSPGAFCQDWTSAAGGASATQIRGHTSGTGTTWTNSFSAGCANTIRLICFEQ